MPWSEILGSELFLQAGIAGALMVFVLLLITLLLGLGARYISTRDTEWRSFLTVTHNNFITFLKREMEAERGARNQAMEHGLDDVNELTDAVRQNSSAINALASGLGRHDQNAIARHGQIMRELGVIRTLLMPRSEEKDARLQLIREHEAAQKAGD